MDNNATIAQRINECAKTKGVSVRKMLQELGLNQNYVSQLRRATNPPTRNIYLIAEYLGVSTDYLLGTEPVAPAPAEEIDPRYIRLVNAVRQMSPEQVEAWLALLEHQRDGQ